MNDQSCSEDFDKVFQQVLDIDYDGPIPENVLRRLLSAVELVIRRELACENLSRELVGLRVGYLFQTPEDVGDCEIYWVGWGYHPAYNEILDNQLEIFRETVDYPSISATTVDLNFLSDELAKKLVFRLKVEMTDRIPIDVLQTKQIYPFVLGHVVKLLTSSMTESLNIAFARASDCNTTCSDGSKGFEPPGRLCQPCSK